MFPDNMQNKGKKSYIIMIIEKRPSDATKKITHCPNSQSKFPIYSLATLYLSI